MSIKQITTFILLSIGITSFGQYYNEVGLDLSSNQYTTSIFYKRYWSNSAKFSSHIQFGAPITTENLNNFSVAIGSTWYLREEGKKLSIGLIFQTQKIDEEGYISTTDQTPGAPQGPYHYANKGYQLTLAPEIGWSFVINNTFVIYPYVIPVAAVYLDGTQTKEYTVDSNLTSVTDLDEGIRASLAQSVGLKVGFRF